MRRILLYTALLAALFLLLDRAVALALSKFLFPSVLSGEAGGDLNYLLKKKRDTDLLILGSSRARHHVDPARLAPGVALRPYNAGANGVGDLFYAGVVLDLALREGLRPRTVLLQADAWQFDEGDAGDAETATRRARSLAALYPFYDQSPLLRRYVRDHAGFRERTLLLLRAYRFNGKVPNLLAHRLRAPASRDGFEPLQGRLADTTPVAGKPLTALDPDALEAFRAIADLCARHGIRLVVWMPPYFENCACDGMRVALRQALLARGADRVVDFGVLPPSLRSPRRWRDPAHLNADGAGRFTRMLRDSLTSPIPTPRDPASRDTVEGDRGS
jgi:hypothetical protein